MNKAPILTDEQIPYKPDGERDELWADIGKVYQGIFKEGWRQWYPDLQGKGLGLSRDDACVC